VTTRERGSRQHPWLYKRNGALDLSWVLIVLACVVMVLCLFLEGFHLGGFALPVDAWSCLGGFIGICFIAGASRDRAEILAHATMPGQLADAIASGVRPLVRLIDNPDE
jgi:hypothetical protein